LFILPPSEIEYFQPIISSTSIELLVPLKRELVEVRDVLGRKTKDNTNQLLFYIYDDGTVEKRIVIEQNKTS